MVDNHTYPKVMERIRQVLMDDGNLSPMEREEIEKTGRFMLGCDPSDKSIRVYLTSQEVYQEIETAFPDYVPNVAATSREIEIIMKIVRQKGLEGKKILDAPCGTARIAHGLAEQGVKGVMGLDLSAELLKAAKASQDQLKSEGSTLTRGNLFRLPYKDKSFKMVVV